MNRCKAITVLLVVSLFLTVVKGQEKLIEILKEELQREMEEFKGEKYPPYYMAYRLNEIESSTIMSSFGSTIKLDSNKVRMCYPTVRIGGYARDNTHGSNEGNNLNRGMQSWARLPIENEKLAIAQYLWQSTDNAYRTAINNYSNGKFNDVDEKDTIPDFTKEKATHYIQEESGVSKLNSQVWKVRLNKLTDRFNADENIIDGNASLIYITDRKYFVSTEGSEVKQVSTYCHVYVNGIVRAFDGMICPLNLSYFSFTPDELPSEQKMLDDVDALIARLNKLKDAPLAEPYEGPAILSSKAAGVFFHEIFGHRVEGHRTRQKTDGQTFTDKVGQKVLPDGFNVVFDPTIDRLNEKLLSGGYLFDDEGILGKRTEVVTDGILQGFLMSRCPIDKTTLSNGHGRAQAGRATVTRQSNMIVSADKTYPIEKLRKQLVKECKKQGKAFGYLFQEVSGGFTQVNRFSPNAFNVSPLEVYKIYVDGRPDELVRGVSMIGTPLAMFAEIVSAGDKVDVFSGYCGAESGSVPVSTISPALFVKQVETQKQMNVETSETILDRPGLRKSKQVKK